MITTPICGSQTGFRLARTLRSAFVLPTPPWLLAHISHSRANCHAQARVQGELVQKLSHALPVNVVINMRWLWNSWQDYVDAFKRVGGVVEASPLTIHASPSANLFIEPDGNLSLTSTHEQIFSSTFTFVGAAFPQISVPFPALREATIAVGRACYERGIVGHVGVDYVAFMDD